MISRSKSISVGRTSCSEIVNSPNSIQPLVRTASISWRASGGGKPSHAEAVDSSRKRRTSSAGDFENRLGEISADANRRCVDDAAPVDGGAGCAVGQTERGGHVDGRVRAEREKKGHGDDHRLGRQRVNVGDSGRVVEKDGERFGGEVARPFRLVDGRLAAFRAASGAVTDDGDGHVGAIDGVLSDSIGDALADDAGEIGMLAERRRVADQPPVALS